MLFILCLYSISVDQKHCLLACSVNGMNWIRIPPVTALVIVNSFHSMNALTPLVSSVLANNPGETKHIFHFIN
jgi:hypothetical protein